MYDESGNAEVRREDLIVQESKRHFPKRFMLQLSEPDWNDPILVGAN